MSLKYFAQKIGENHYVLPRTGKMRVDAHAFFSELLFERTEESMWVQIANAAAYEGVIGAYMMPDAHSGYGVPVGCVVVTEDTIIQAGSGYDISCGVLYMRVPGLTAEHVADWDRRARWIDEVDKRVATGVGSGRPALMPRFSSKKADEVLRYGAKAIGVSADLCERQYIEVPEDVDLGKIERAYQKVVPQLGSVGGGNHFIEMQVDRDSGLPPLSRVDMRHVGGARRVILAPVSKAFTKDDSSDAPLVVPARPPLPEGVANYVTPRDLVRFGATVTVASEGPTREGDQGRGRLTHGGAVRASRLDQRGRPRSQLSKRVSGALGQSGQ